MSEQHTLRVGRAAVEAARAEVAALEAAGKASEIDPMVRRIADAQVVTPEPVPSGAMAGTPTAELESPRRARLYVRDAQTGLVYSSRSTAGRRLMRMLKTRDATLRDAEVQVEVLAARLKASERPKALETPTLAPRPHRRFALERAEGLERETPF